MYELTAVIETPKGSAEKYDYEPEQKAIKLNKILPAGMVFPFDFGFIPDTMGGDGDPLDIFVIYESKSFPGCLIDCRIIGAIKAEQTEQGNTVRNDRFLGVFEKSALFENIHSINDLPEKIITEIEHFFIAYNEVTGKNFKPVGRLDAKEAFEMIKTNQGK